MVITRQGFEVFHSVRVNGFEIDLVGVWQNDKGDVVTLAIETKPTITREGLDKALEWRWDSSYFALAVERAPTIGLATTLLAKYTGLGLYVGTREEIAPVLTSSSPMNVHAFADAARNSSKGILIQGGSRSPKKATRPILEAEKVLERLKQDGTPNQSLRGILGDVSSDELEAVAKVLRKSPGHSLTVRNFGDDVLVSPR